MRGDGNGQGEKYIDLKTEAKLIRLEEGDSKGDSQGSNLGFLCEHLQWLVDQKGDFLGSSAGKESACNAGDPGSIPGSGSSPGEGIAYPFQYSWASLVAQMVKNLPPMLETWV